MDDDFSNFTVVITIGNQTLTLNLHRDEAIVYLAPGNYTVSITVYYTVKPNPHGPPNVVNKPLITIKPAGEHEHEETSNNSTNAQGNEVTSYFYLTGFCFLPCKTAFKLTPLTMTTLNLTPGRSP